MPPDDLRAECPWVRSLQDLIQKKKRWGVSVASLNYALHKIGKISDWHYRGYYMALAKIGREYEPEPMPPETSTVWMKILVDLWRHGMPLSRVAEQLNLPEKELNDLLFGIAVPSGPPVARGTSLRAVS
jgi:Zn-dependent peptidase ImmA (M78 family)